MFKFNVSLAVIALVCFSCNSSSDSIQDVEKEQVVQTISFENYFQKISYAIGLDHGTAGHSFYANDRLKDKLDLEEIENGLVDYLSTNPLRIQPLGVDSILSMYLLADGNVDSSIISKTDGSYAIGLNEAIVLVSTFVARGIDQDIDVSLLTKGIKDGLNGVKSSYDLNDARQDLSSFYANVNKKNGEDFLAYNKNKDGIITTESGLQYQVFETGSGSSPNAADSVVVHYTGRFIDGQEFESSVPSGKPIQFAVLQVIKGWTEGLKLMKAGGQYRFFIPYDLAYGEVGSGAIEPFTTLIFDIELIKVIKYIPNH